MFKSFPFLLKLLPVLVAVALVFFTLKNSERLGELKLENRQLRVQITECERNLNSCAKQLNNCTKQLNRQQKRGGSNPNGFNPKERKERSK